MSTPSAATINLVSPLLLRPEGPLLYIERIAMAPVDLLISQSMIKQIPSLITSPSVSESDREMLSNYKIKIWGIKINGEPTLEGHCLVGEKVDISIYWDVVQPLLRMYSRDKLVRCSKSPS